MSGRGLPPIFFVHVMKTGGTSVASLLRSTYPPGSSYPREKGFRHQMEVDLALGLSAEERAETSFYSTHLPPWVARVVAPDHLALSILRHPVGRTISHLRQIARGHEVDDLEKIYADARWRARLVNYQTQVFSATRELHELTQQRFLARVAERLEAGSATDAAASEESGIGGPFDHAFYTALGSERVVDREDLAIALDAVASLDMVGVTERIDDFVAAVADRTGVALGAAGRANAATDSLRASSSLQTRIEEDNQLDLELYEFVRSRSPTRG